MRHTIPIVLLAIAATACSGSPQAAAMDPKAVTATIGRVERTSIASTFEAGGVLRPRLTAIVASRVMATVAAVHARPGDRVRRGQTLVTLDAREAAAHARSATAALAAATETAEATQADISAAEAQVRLATVTHTRVRTLHEQRSATTHELDQAVAALAAAEAHLASARARRAAAAAAKNAAHAAADAAAVTSTYALLAAPFDGVVTERHADPGSMAAPGVPLLTVEDTALFRLEVDVDEARVARLAEGDTVDVRLDNLPGLGWRPGRIAEIARVDPASHAFVVKVDVPPQPGWRSGLYGRARFAGVARMALTIPAVALVQRGQLSFAFVVDGEGRARLKAVRTGQIAGDRVEVLAGLTDGDRVVLAPPDTLADGTRVTP